MAVQSCMEWIPIKKKKCFRKDSRDLKKPWKEHINGNSKWSRPVEKNIVTKWTWKCVEWNLVWRVRTLTRRFCYLYCYIFMYPSVSLVSDEQIFVGDEVELKAIQWRMKNMLKEKTIRWIGLVQCRFLKLYLLV